MKVVIDANVLIAALIRDSMTRQLIIMTGSTLYFPARMLQEVHNAKPVILRKSGLTEQEYHLLLSILLKHIILVEENDLQMKMPEAIELMKNIDINDAPFVAAALVAGACIWSEDKHLLHQSRVKAYTTSEIKDRLILAV